MTEPITEITSSLKIANRDMDDGRFGPVYMIRLRTHPRCAEIIEMIKNRKALKLSYRRLPDAIEQKFGIKLGYSFLITFYRNNFVTDETLQYMLDTKEKRLAALEELYKAMADMQMERYVRRLDFEKELEMGMGIPGSYKRTEAVMRLQLEILKLGAAVGFFPDLNLQSNIQNNQPNQNFDIENINPRIMQMVGMRLHGNIDNSRMMQIVQKFVPETPDAEPVVSNKSDSKPAAESSGATENVMQP